jgi:hypothetical protein
VTKMKPADKLRAWKSEDALSRVLGCACMLVCHEFLTDGERAKVQRRIEKWKANYGMGNGGRNA